MTWGLARTKHSISVVFMTMQSYILTPDRSTLVRPPRPARTRWSCQPNAEALIDPWPYQPQP